MEQIEAQARQRGDRDSLAAARLGLISTLFELGRWQEALVRADEEDELQASPWASAEVISALPVLCEQGRLAAADALLQEHEWQRDAEQAALAASFAASEARLLRAHNRPADALAAASRGLTRHDLGGREKEMKRCLIEALEAAVHLDDLDQADELLASVETLQPGRLTPTMEGQRARFRARLAARRGNHDNVEDEYLTAERIFAEHAFAFHHAVTQTEHAEWLTGQGRPDNAQPLLAEARETFERLEARPWLERLEATRAAAPDRIPA